MRERIAQRRQQHRQRQPRCERHRRRRRRLRRHQVQEEEDQVRLQGRAAIPERGQDCPEVRKTEEEDVGPMNTGVDDGSGKIRSNKKHLNFLKF